MMAGTSPISAHGHYPFMNLYEANIVGIIDVDDVWGPNAPGNTFFRNRVLGTDQHEDFGDRDGFRLRAYHGTQYLIGNEINGEGIIGDISDVVLHGNNVNGEVAWDPTITEYRFARFLLPLVAAGFL